MNQDQAGAYLAGMIDGEGHIRNSARGKRNVSVANTDWDIVQAVVDCCTLLGLHHTVLGPRGLPSGKSVWEVNVSGRESLERLRGSVPLQCARKRQALDAAIAAYKFPVMPSREWLEQKYVQEGWTLRECAQAWGFKNATSAMNWMNAYGIQRRTTSEAALARGRRTTP